MNVKTSANKSSQKKLINKINIKLCWVNYLINNNKTSDVTEVEKVGLSWRLCCSNSKIKHVLGTIY